MDYGAKGLRDNSLQETVFFFSCKTFGCVVTFSYQFFVTLARDVEIPLVSLPRLVGMLSLLAVSSDLFREA